MHASGKETADHGSPMTNDGKGAPQHPPQTPGQSTSAPSGFGLLAKRISSWTTKCIVTGVILVLGIGVGRQVLQWWKGDVSGSVKTPPAVGVGDGLGEPGGAHEIQFGASSWTLRRQSFAGPREAALSALRASCRDATRSGGTPEGYAEEAEEKLLDSLLNREPVDQEPARWGLYQLDQSFPMVIGTREAAPGPPANHACQVAGSGRRVVTWGLAVPMSQGAWTLYTFHPTGPSSGLQPGLPELPMPPASRRILALQVAGGGSITALAGPAQPETWKRCFDRWFETRGWAAAGNWDHAGSRWSRCYVEKTEGPAARADVQLAADGSGGMSGLLLVTPPAAQTTESKSP